MKHFPNDDSLEFKSPKMKIHEKKGLPWNVVSDSAWVNSDRSLVILNGEVYIWRMDLEGNKQYEILTSDLTIKPLEKFAHTTKAARITTQGIVTNTVGLKLFLRKEESNCLKECAQYMNLNKPVLFLIVLLHINCILLQALPGDSNEPIEIEADFAELDDEKGETIYVGNVVTQGSLRMTGEKLRIILTKQRILIEQ